jgi:signal transduction histidine kinase/CheY-like chemotaxis protein
MDGAAAPIADSQRTSLATCDWSATPLGAVETWTPTLKAAVEVCLSTAQPAMVWWGPEQRLVCNARCAALLRGGRAPGPGQALAEGWPELAAAAAPLIESARARGFASQRIDRHGAIAERNAEYVLTAGALGDGGATGFFVTVSEPAGEALEAERRSLGEQQELARAAGERAARMKDEFIATISHELRTPLGAIVLWSKMLRAGELHENEQERALDAIIRAAGMQGQLISDLLDMSRISSGKLSLRRSTIELDGPIEAAAAAARPAAAAKNITLLVDLHAADVQIWGDPPRLQQVLGNLLQNAIKFTPAGGGVTVRTEPAGDQVAIDVIDTGEGMDAALLERLFAPFQQRDASSTRRQGGLGLGLAIAHHLVCLHGGRIEPSSAGPQRGSTFRVLLPRVRTTSAEEGGSSEPGAASLANLRVLVVEDETDTREAVRLLLGQHGAAATAVASAADAMAALEREWPDVLLADIAMPDEDGYALMRRVRARESGLQRGCLPGVAMSAYAAPEDVERALAAGFQAHLAKPLEPEQLVTALAAAGRSR